jgi:PKD-like domain/Beta-propeller repeat/Secretion system C-terminal sorting domain
MKRIVLITCLLISLSLSGQAPVFEWAAQLGGGFVDNGYAIATDSFGNVYTTGSFMNNQILSDTADFDPGVDFYGLFSNGGADIFVSKLSPDGDLVWAVSFGDTGGDRGHGITTDADGNVYVVGLFKGSVDFDPGQGSYPLISSFNHSSSFVLKLDTNGSLIWARELGDGPTFSSASSVGYSIAVDNEGNVYTTGSTTNGGDFDPGPEEFILTTNTNSPIIFISKLDSDGNFVWAKAIGGEGFEISHSIVLDDYNNVYLTGVFSDTIDFDPGSNEYNLWPIGGGDLFILKLDGGGEFIWAKKLGGTSPSGTHGNAIAIDVGGNVYATGVFFENVDFDPGSATYELSASEKDIFILKLNNNGEFIWAKAIGGDAFQDSAQGIALDPYNNVYITGIFQDTVDFDPGSGTYALYSGEDAGAYVLKLTEDGTFVWAVSFPGDEGNYPGEYNSGESIALDQWNNIYTTGSFWRTTDFDPDSIINNLTAYGTTDIFVQKMSQSCYTGLEINSLNSDLSICPFESITLISELPSSIENVSYFWNTGDTLNSIVVAPDSTSAFSVIVSYPYNAQICSFTDSVEVMILPVPDTTYLNFSTCDSMAAGVIEFVFPSLNGCDSIVIETTGLMPMPEMPNAPADIVIQENEPPFQLTVLVIINATEYEWTVPSDVQIISGQGTNTITVDWSGLTIGGSVCVSAVNECGSSPADCMEVTIDISDALDEIKTKNYSIFPNPADALLNIVFKDGELYEILLLDVLGRTVIPSTIYSGRVDIDIRALTTGTYWLKIIDEGEVFWEQIEIIK